MNDAMKQWVELLRQVKVSCNRLTRVRRLRMSWQRRNGVGTGDGNSDDHADDSVVVIQAVTCRLMSTGLNLWYMLV